MLDLMFFLRSANAKVFSQLRCDLFSEYSLTAEKVLLLNTLRLIQSFIEANAKLRKIILTRQIRIQAIVDQF